MIENYLSERQFDVQLTPVHTSILEVDVLGLDLFPSYPESTSHDRAQPKPTD